MESTAEKPIERRKYKRYRMQNGVFAVLGPQSSRMGQIIDISNGGVAFYHKDTHAKPEQNDELSILMDNNQATVSYGPLKFQANIVWETPIDTSRHSGITRRCGLEFKELTYYQRAWLVECIKNHTVSQQDAVP
ncbi:MAG: PilZ domain-containing protein [Thermodesulfobacteriota bacterium]